MSKRMFLLAGFVVPFMASAVDLESDLRDYTMGRMEADKLVLKEDLSALRVQQRELGKRISTTDLKTLQDAMGREESKAILLREMRARSVGRIDKKLLEQVTFDNTDIEKLAVYAGKKVEDAEKALRTAESDKTVLEKSLQEAKKQQIPTVEIERNLAKQTSEVEEKKRVLAAAKSGETSVFKEVDVPNTMMKLVGELRTTKDGNHEIVYNLKANINEFTKLPDKVRKNMSDLEIAEYFDKKIGKNVGSTYLIEGLLDASSLDAALKQAHEDKAVASVLENFKQRSEDEKYEAESTLKDKQEDYKEKTDGREKARELKEARAKEKVATWLQSHSAKKPNGEDMDPCEVLIKAVGWKDLPEKAQQQCADQAPEKAAKKTETDKSAADAQRAQVEKQMADTNNQLLGLVQHCLGLYRNQNAQSANRSVIDTIQPIYEQMLKQGFSCEFFSEMIGQSVINGANPVADITLNQDDAVSQSQRIVTTTMKTKEGNEKLERERSCTAKIMQIAANSLALAAGSSPMGLADPALQSDPKVQQLLRYQSTSIALLAALDRERQARLDEANNKFGGLNNGANGVRPQGVPTVGVSGTGRSSGVLPSGATVPVQNREKPRYLNR